MQKVDEESEKLAAMDIQGDEPKEPSKNALKKAQKMEKLAREKGKSPTDHPAKGADKSDAKKSVNKAPKKKIEGAALIGIDVAKEDDFSGWYQQVNFI